MENSETLQLSEYAILRNVENRLRLEEPTRGFSVPIRKGAILQLLVDFLGPQNPQEYLDRQPAEARPAVARMIEFLAEKGVLGRPRGPLSETRRPADLWQFHDLYFHTQSRAGRNLARLGATYRFGADTSAPHRPQPWTGAREYFPADAGAADRLAAISLKDALEGRRSSYEFGAVGAGRLGALLEHSLKVKRIEPDGAAGGALRKFYPSGGGRHSLECYVAVFNCPDLASDLYYYEATEHCLVRIDGRQKLLESLLGGAQRATGKDGVPAALLVFTARFGRVFEKYESLGYRLIMAELGTAYQTLYLAAGALGLSVCALGSGDSSEFAEELGLDYFEETSIGEFVINGIL